MPVQHLKEFLEQKGVAYQCIAHPPAYTAQQLAHHTHIAGDHVAKTVIIELDGKMAMLVMPATWRVRWDRLYRVLETDFIALADEASFKDCFEDCEVGAMPPFGNLFGMQVYCCEALTLQTTVAFPAGNHEESITMAVSDYLELVHPTVLDKGFTRPDAPKPQWLRRPRQQMSRDAG